MADGETNSKLSGASVRRRAFDPINMHYFGRLCSPVDEGFLAVRTPHGWWPREEVEDVGLTLKPEVEAFVVRWLR